MSKRDREAECHKMVNLIVAMSNGDLQAEVREDEHGAAYVWACFSDRWIQETNDRHKTDHTVMNCLQAVLVPLDEPGWIAHSFMPDRFDYHPPVDVRDHYGASDEDAVNFIMGEWFF